MHRHDQMREQQLELFSLVGTSETPLRGNAECPQAATVSAAALDDQSLIAAIPESNLAESKALAAEVGRRRLAAAVPNLEALCRRFSGFGTERVVPEQAAALEALGMIKDREASTRGGARTRVEIGNKHSSTIGLTSSGWRIAIAPPTP